MQNMPEEKRRFVRLNVLTDIVYTKRQAPEKEKLSLAKNISMGGICLIVYEELKKSDMLDLKIFLPEDKTPISAAGRVDWVKEFLIGDAYKGRRFDVGIEFIEISEENKNKINKYVFSHI